MPGVECALTVLRVTLAFLVSTRVFALVAVIYEAGTAVACSLRLKAQPSEQKTTGRDNEEHCRIAAPAQPEVSDRHGDGESTARLSGMASQAESATCGRLRPGPDSAREPEPGTS